jgi:plasmid stability protein
MRLADRAGGRRTHDCYHDVMAQLSLRLPDELAAQVRSHAARAGRSTNAWIALVLAAAVDPELAGDDVERTRERLARAGLLAPPARAAGRPDPRRVERARRAAAGGRELGAIVADERR